MYFEMVFDIVHYICNRATVEATFLQGLCLIPRETCRQCPAATAKDRSGFQVIRVFLHEITRTSLMNTGGTLTVVELTSF